jgi:hypothetical protein
MIFSPLASQLILAACVIFGLSLAFFGIWWSSK